jgi:hypothetical protein
MHSQRLRLHSTHPLHLQVLPGSVLALAAARVASAAGLLCSLGAIFMARYTQGHEGFVMTGYIV